MVYVWDDFYSWPLTGKLCWLVYLYENYAYAYDSLIKGRYNEYCTICVMYHDHASPTLTHDCVD